MTTLSTHNAVDEHAVTVAAIDVEAQRTSSIRVSSPVSEDGRLGLNRDSLHSTRDYYGLTPIAGPSHSQTLSGPHRSKSPSTRQSRSLSNATSRHSGASRPTSPEASRRLSGATIRSTIPLPLHRGFLSPKKPKAAIQLEARQRQESLMKEQRNGDVHTEAEEEAAVLVINPEKGERISEEMETALDADHDPSTFGSKSSGNTGPINGFAEAGQGRAPHFRHSLGEGSSQHATGADYSSDDLVATKNNQYPPNGVDAEKGQLRVKKSSISRRPSYHERQSSSKRSARHPDTPQRRYQLFENPLSTFLFKGHAMTGGDNYLSVALIIVLLFGITGVWFGTTGVWYWQSAGRYGLASGGGIAIDIIFVYLFGLTLSSLLAASLREPGIIPRDLDPHPPMTQGETDSWRQPLDREFAVKQGRVVVRYCETCRSYRPPRASHCRLCGNCVDGIDHHCSYLHTCVGKRTYLSFLVLLGSAGIAAIYQVVFSALHFALLCHVDSIGFGTALRQSPGAAVSFLIGVIVLPGIGFLLVYHFRLLLYNLTTVEQIRASASSNLLKATKRPDNPFASNSILSNILLSTLGRPQFPSWVQAWKVVEPERRMPNPALTEERWIKMGYDKGMR